MEGAFGDGLRRSFPLQPAMTRLYAARFAGEDQHPPDETTRGAISEGAGSDRASAPGARPCRKAVSQPSPRGNLLRPITVSSRRNSSFTGLITQSKRSPPAVSLSLSRGSPPRSAQRALYRKFRAGRAPAVPSVDLTQ